MSALICPRCRRANPGVAYFCYFDGAELRPGFDGAAGGVNRLAQEFVFPSGRRCRTFDELAQGCQEDWQTAKDLLRKGVFGQFFTVNGRADLIKATQEAQSHADADIALIRFVNALPVSRTQAPRLDLSPRRLLLGNLMAGESRKVQLTVSNQGQGVLQGTLKVTEGNQWLHVGEGSSNGECALRTAGEQHITLTIDTRGLPAAQTYGAKLTVITNGGVVEVPARMDLVAHPFARPPFQGARTPREMAERMRSQPKAAGPLLESGEIGRWFASNGWNYPVRGTPAHGVAGVQQFFEAMGLSKPPSVTVGQSEVTFACSLGENPRFQVALRTAARKWVYAHVESDSPWLKVLTPQATGPQQCAIAFEIDSRSLAGGRGEGTLHIVANAGQKLSIRVSGQVRGARVHGGKGRLLPAMAAMALCCFLVRLLLVPVVDVLGGSPAVRAAAQKVNHPTDPDRLSQFIRDQTAIRNLALAGGDSAKLAERQGKLAGRLRDFHPEAGKDLTQPVLRKADQEMEAARRQLEKKDKKEAAKGIALQNQALQKMEEAREVLAEQSPLQGAAGWLSLPWGTVLRGSESFLPAELFNTVDKAPVPTQEFRHYFLSAFLRRFVAWTWWLGAVWGLVVMWRRRQGPADLAWGIIAGAAAGIAFGATLACAILLAELVPHALFHPQHAGVFGLLGWIFLVLVYWIIVGLLLGLLLGWLKPVGKIVLAPVQNGLARIFRICGLKGLAAFWAPA